MKHYFFFPRCTPTAVSGFSFLPIGRENFWRRSRLLLLSHLTCRPLSSASRTWCTFLSLFLSRFPRLCELRLSLGDSCLAFSLLRLCSLRRPPPLLVPIVAWCTLPLAQYGLREAENNLARLLLRINDLVNDLARRGESNSGQCKITDCKSLKVQLGQ